MQQIKRLFMAAIVLVFLVGCGKKGPLYLPDKNKQSAEQASVNTSSLSLLPTNPK